MRVLLPLLLLLALACASSHDDDTAAAPIAYEGDDASECEDGADNDRDGRFDCDDSDCAASPACDAADDSGTTGETDDPCADGPVITRLGAGPLTNEGDTWVVFDIEVSDPSDDLTTLTTEFWWDETVDGAVDTSGEPFVFPRTLDGSTSGHIGPTLYVDGDPLQYDTEYEFAVKVADSAGCVSDAAIVAEATPTQP